MLEKVSNPASSELLSIVREKLLEIEEKCGVPRRRFAQEVLQVSDKTYYNICVGTATLDLKMLDRMASNLGVSVRVLVDAAPMPDKFDWPAVSRRRRQQTRRVGFAAAQAVERDADAVA